MSFKRGREENNLEGEGVFNETEGSYRRRRIWLCPECKFESFGVSCIYCKYSLPPEKDLSFDFDHLRSSEDDNLTNTLAVSSSSSSSLSTVKNRENVQDSKHRPALGAIPGSMRKQQIVNLNSSSTKKEAKVSKKREEKSEQETPPKEEVEASRNNLIDEELLDGVLLSSQQVKALKARSEAEIAFSDISRASSKRVFFVPSIGRFYDNFRNSPLVDNCKNLCTQAVKLQESAFSAEDLKALGQDSWAKDAVDHIAKIVPKPNNISNAPSRLPPFPHPGGPRGLVAGFGPLNPAFAVPPGMDNNMAAVAASGVIHPATSFSSRVFGDRPSATAMASSASSSRLRIVAPKPLHPDVMGNGSRSTDLNGVMKMAGDDKIGKGGQTVSSTESEVYASSLRGRGYNPAVDQHVLNLYPSLSHFVPPTTPMLPPFVMAPQNLPSKGPRSNPATTINQFAAALHATTPIGLSTLRDQNAFHTAMDVSGHNLRNGLATQLNQRAILHQQLNQHRDQQIFRAQQQTSMQPMQTNPMWTGNMGGSSSIGQRIPYAQQPPLPPSASAATAATSGVTIYNNSVTSMSTMPRLAAAPPINTGTAQGGQQYSNTFGGSGGGSLQTTSNRSIILGHMGNNQVSTMTPQVTPSSAQVVVEPEEDTSVDI